MTEIPATLTQTAAAATCLLAHGIRKQLEAEPQADITGDSLQLPFNGRIGSRVAAALARPGLPAAIAECKNSQHAAGVLAVILAQLEDDGGALDPLPADVAAPLAAALPAVLAAPTNNLAASGNALHRRRAAARLLEAVAARAGAADAAQLLQPAAAFVAELDADVEHALCVAFGIRSGIDEAAASRGSAVGSSGSGSDLSHSQLDAIAALQHLAAPASLAVAGMFALLHSARQSPGAGGSAAAAISHAAQQLAACLQHTLRRLALLQPSTAPALEPLMVAAAAEMQYHQRLPQPAQCSAIADLRTSTPAPASALLLWRCGRCSGC